MILAVTKRYDLTRHYDCYAEKSKCKCKSPIWWLRGKEVVMQGGDAFDEVHDLAAGDCPEELLMWAQLQGLDIAKNHKTCYD
jgi:hypothetical protein